ncbi:MAG TPA: hypothetical protein VIH10_00485 [Kribbella sp.]
MPTVTPLLAGYSLTSNQGNPAFCSVLLVESEGRRALFDCRHAGRRRHLLEALAAQGSVIELPGHTPGSIGLLAGTAVLAADAVPSLKVLLAGRASGRPYDRERADASVDRVAGLAEVVYPGHDGAVRRSADGGFEYVGNAVPLMFRVP